MTGGRKGVNGFGTSPLSEFSSCALDNVPLARDSIVHRTN